METNKQKPSDLSFGARIQKSTMLSLDSCLNPNPRMKSELENQVLKSQSTCAQFKPPIPPRVPKNDVSFTSSSSGNRSSTDSLHSTSSGGSSHSHGSTSSNRTNFSAIQTEENGCSWLSYISSRAQNASEINHNSNFLDQSVTGFASTNSAFNHSINRTFDSARSQPDFAPPIPPRAPCPKMCEKPVKEYCAQTLAPKIRKPDVGGVEVSSHFASFPEMAAILKNPGN